MGRSLGLLGSASCSCQNFFRLFPTRYSSSQGQLFELLGLAGLFRLLGTCEFFWCWRNTVQAVPASVEHGAVIRVIGERFLQLPEFFQVTSNSLFEFAGPVIRVTRVSRVISVIGYLRIFLVLAQHGTGGASLCGAW